jgi:peptidoglycan-N-acetylglucosamine deacetylase
MDRDEPALRRSAVTRRVLLAAGGLMLLGEVAATEGHGTASKAAARAHAETAAPGTPRPSVAHEAAAGAAQPTHSAHPARPADPHSPSAQHPAAAGPDGQSGKAAQERRRAQRGQSRPPDGEPLYTLSDGPKRIALTIDDGPSPLYTPQILTVLHKYRVTATFSMIGVNVAAHPALAREVAAAGHTIVNHTWTHANLAMLGPVSVADQMARANDAIHKATGRHPAMFRAPYGAWSPAVLRRCEQMKLRPLDWSVDPRDWARPGVTAIVDNIMRHTETGSIILEHDGGGNRSETVAALKIVLPRLLDAGYHFRTP